MPSVCFDSSFARISLSSASAHCHIARANAPGRGGDRPRIPPVSRARAPGPASPPKLQRSCDSTEEEDGEEVERAGAEKGTRRAKRARQRRKRKERARTSRECIWRGVQCGVPAQAEGTRAAAWKLGNIMIIIVKVVILILTSSIITIIVRHRWRSHPRSSSYASHSSAARVRAEPAHVAR